MPELETHRWNDSAWSGLADRIPRLPHAVLLHGPRGVGKLALALRLSQAILCETRTGTQPCGRCEGCRWFGDGNHPDFRLVQPEAMDAEEPDGEDPPAEGGGRKGKPSVEIKVSQIRELADFLHTGSHRGGRRVALVQPAEAMNANAANALLKGLEEPPPGAMFVLVSHAFGRLLPTIRSRCVKVPVAVPDAEAAQAWLRGQGVADADRWLAYAGGAPLLAHELATGERAAELRSVLDQLAAGGRPTGVNTRESLELLAEALQKLALDAAFQGLAGRARFGTWGARRAPGGAEQWLAFARDMGRNRALARRPLNPGLFADDLLSRVPGRK